MNKKMRRFVLVFSACIGPLLVGCDPAFYRVHVRLTAPEADRRVFSVQMLTPSTTASERVICNGTFTAALLEASADTMDDFFAGDATLSEIRDARVRFIVQESGESRVFRLPARRLPTSSTLYTEIFVPADLKKAEVKWARED